MQALRLAGARAECDVLIVARGGGSLEDLLAFNDEAVARAIFACPIPIISGIGHETDFTIADFVADERAPTPSGAAERAVPDRAEFLRALGVRAAARRERDAPSPAIAAARVLQSERGLARTHPGARLRQHAQRLDELESRLRRCVHARLEQSRVRLAGARALLARSSPARRVAQAKTRLAVSQRSLAHAMHRRLRDAHARWDRSRRTLHAVSPLATLERGYAIVLDDTGSVLTDAASEQARRRRHGAIGARVAACDGRRRSCLQRLIHENRSHEPRSRAPRSVVLAAINGARRLQHACASRSCCRTVLR